jgi:hypothetical protein
MAGELIRGYGYGCGATAEAGCFAGDTTCDLARSHPQLPVCSCVSVRPLPHLPPAAGQASGGTLPIATKWIGMSYGGVNITAYSRRRGTAKVTSG